jgi:hypothetical protein
MGSQKEICSAVMIKVKIAPRRSGSPSRRRSSPAPTRLSNEDAACWVNESAIGIVSRVSPVHTAVRNCTRDEGRSFEVGNQVLISSHRKLLSSKAMVVNVAEKSEQGFDRHD